MPEFMLTAKSDDVNYASALVAEGPAVKMFERLQAEQIEYDLEVLQKAVELAGGQDGVPEDAWDRVVVTAHAPSVVSRNHLDEAKINETYQRARIKSAQTISAELGLDYDAEQRNFNEQEQEMPL